VVMKVSWTSVQHASSRAAKPSGSDERYECWVASRRSQ
jgi:hypothetical protein